MFPQYVWTAESAHSYFIGSRVQAFLDVNYYLHYWQNGQGSFMCPCDKTGVERTQNNSQHKKLTLEKKILPQLLPFDHESGALSTELFRPKRSNTLGL